MGTSNDLIYFRIYIKDKIKPKEIRSSAYKHNMHKEEIQRHQDSIQECQSQPSKSDQVSKRKLETKPEETGNSSKVTSNAKKFCMTNGAENSTTKHLNEKKNSCINVSSNSNVVSESARLMPPPQPINTPNKELMVTKSLKSDEINEVLIEKKDENYLEENCNDADVLSAALTTTNYEKLREQLSNLHAAKISGNFVYQVAGSVDALFKCSEAVQNTLTLKFDDQLKGVFEKVS